MKKLTVADKSPQMLKRCHSLKKSQIRLANLTNACQCSHHSKAPKSSCPEKENIIMIHNYSNIQFSKSIEITKSSMVTSTSKSVASFDEEANTEQKQNDGIKPIDAIKKLCKDIELMDKKIEMYRDIIANKQARHDKQKSSKIEQNQRVLSVLIELYQKQRERSEELWRQMRKIRKQFQLQYSQDKECQLQRRSTATFNYDSN